MTNPVNKFNIVCVTVCPDCEKSFVFGIEPVKTFQDLIEEFSDNLICPRCGSTAVGIREMSLSAPDLSNLRGYASYEVPLYRGPINE